MKIWAWKGLRSIVKYLESSYHPICLCVVNTNSGSNKMFKNSSIWPFIIILTFRSTNPEGEVRGQLHNIYHTRKEIDKLGTIEWHRKSFVPVALSLYSSSI